MELNRDMTGKFNKLFHVFVLQTLCFFFQNPLFAVGLRIDHHPDGHITQQLDPTIHHGWVAEFHPDGSKIGYSANGVHWAKTYADGAHINQTIHALRDGSAKIYQRYANHSLEISVTSLAHYQQPGTKAFYQQNEDGTEYTAREVFHPSRSTWAILGEISQPGVPRRQAIFELIAVRDGLISLLQPRPIKSNKSKTKPETQENQALQKSDEAVFVVGASSNN